MDNLFLQAEAAAGLDDGQIRGMLKSALESCGKRLNKVLLLPPDITRLMSYAGQITRILYELLPNAEIDFLPALGTHFPMTARELDEMYPGLPHERFLVHRWRDDVECIGEVPAEFISKVTEGLVNEPVAVEVNHRLLDPSYDLIISVGQVVPHEIVGMANFNKNIFVGCGGSKMINASHYIGALYGMERMIGRDDTPLHRIFDYAHEHFLRKLPLMFVMTTIAADDTGSRVMSLAAGESRELFSKSIAVSQQHNITLLDKPLKKIVAYLHPDKYHTVWVANKAIYRACMALADGGEIVVVAPGVSGFGEDQTIDRLIRGCGYFGRKRILELIAGSDELRENRGVAAHLVFGSPEGRYTVTYVPGSLTKQEVEKTGYGYMSFEEAQGRYKLPELKEGFNSVNGEEIFYLGNPASGLWAHRERFLSAAP